MSRLDTFEGSYLGDDSKLSDGAKLECGICWHVYDPEKGDDVWQVAPGTPFARLPGHWRCPQCDAPKHKFMLIGEAGPTRDRAASAPVDTAARIDAVLAAYQAADRRMQGLPVYNDRLAVATIGFRRVEEDLVGVVLTPWAMNLLTVPVDAAAVARPEGSKRLRRFPSGEYEFVAGHLEGVGAIEACSLFSPMEDFSDRETAEAVAAAAIAALFEPDEPGAGLPSGERFARPGAATDAPEAADPDVAGTMPPPVEPRPSRRDLFVPRA
jgi:[NiFe] hydrogenase assembly HybE family chaperone